MPRTSPFLVLHGSAGVRKTALAHAALKHVGYAERECNASDMRVEPVTHIPDEIFSALYFLFPRRVCLFEKKNVSKKRRRKNKNWVLGGS